MSVEVKPSSERKCTNVPALVFTIIFLALTVILVTYCGIVGLGNPKSSANETLLTLEDGCGNICGQLNINGSLECGNPDKRNATKLFVEKIENSFDEDYEFENTTELEAPVNQTKAQCVEECPENYIDISNICNLNSTVIDLGKVFEEIMDSIKSTWYYILIISFVAFIFSYVFLVLFRYAAKYVIWIINIGFVVIVIALGIFCAVVGLIPVTIIFLIVALIMILVLCYFKQRINLVAKLFKETSKALIDVPSIMFEPILTFISLFISFAIYIAFYKIISSAGKEEPIAYYAHLFNFISFTFIIQFVIGCQNFVIAGTICRWYFTRDKTKLRKPVKKSFSHLFKFHLGSVCFSAILVTLVKLLKSFLDNIKKAAIQSKTGWVVILAGCLLCIVDIIQKVLVYLVRNAYIVIAKDGTPFIESGKRAFNLLAEHIKDVIALNHFGDIVLLVCKLLITLIAGFVGFAVLSKRDDFPVATFIFGIIFAFLIAHTFVMVFEMTVDTIFISFCIDLEENDGQMRPFYMSDSLREVIMEMKELAGGTLVIGPQDGHGIPGGFTDGSGIPMLPMQQQQPMYPNLGYGDPNGPPQQQYTQQPYPQQSYPQQSYPQQPYPPMMPPQDYPDQKY